MRFEEIARLAAQHLRIVERVYEKSPMTQLVIGEMHYHPRVQRDVLAALLFLKDHLSIGMFGKEGAPLQPLSHDVDVEQAAKSVEYMQELVSKKIYAGSIFAHTHKEIPFEAVDSAELRTVSSRIDRRCRLLQALKRKKGWEGMSQAERKNYEFWFFLLKEVVLGKRSAHMAKRLYDVQRDTKVPLALLLCGAAHTPFREAHRPYSVVQTLQTLPLNYIIAVPQSVHEILLGSEPFDFWSHNDGVMTGAKAPKHKKK